jgi:hypothetical protein
LPVATKENQTMADGVSGILTQLKRMREGIEEAILALERIERVEAPATTPATAPATKSVATNRRSEGQKARYAAKRAAEAPAVVTKKTAPRKGGMSAEGKSRLIAALKARWAAKKAAANGPVVSAPAPAAATSVPRKPRFTAEGRKKLADAMKRRWAVKRAASAVKKQAGRPKKAA